jgi:protein MpaA
MLKKTTLIASFMTVNLFISGCSTDYNYFSKAFLQETNEPDSKQPVLQELKTIKPQDPNFRSHLASEDKRVSEYCHKLERSFKKYQWDKSFCEEMNWSYKRTSVKGDPLLWMTFGEYEPDPTKVETTIIMCGVHGDEITPIKFCFDVINYLKDVSRGKVVDKKTGVTADLTGKFVIVAPLVNPDSYFINNPTRTNANGVDVNRNLPTEDFDRLALKRWEDRYRKDKRRFPGKKAASEPETGFQVDLISDYKPDKILSVHAPLTMLDYDGPASIHTGGVVGSKANELLIKMSEQAKGYRIKNYPLFPGSLGNYAGNERNIPTYTLELPTSDPSKVDTYWNLFKSSVHSAVMQEVRGSSFLALDREEEDQDTKSN